MGSRLSPSIAAFLALLLGHAGADGFPANGTVVGETGEPIPSAVVRVQGTGDRTVTDAGGRFALDVSPPGAVTLTAWKGGYLNGGAAWESRKDGVIRLRRVPPGDNREYRWISAARPRLHEWVSILFWKAVAWATGDERLHSRFQNNCANCHASFIIDQWRQDPHSSAARNPIVLAMYNGTDMDGNLNVFPGYRLDFPGSTGNCATCHAPAQAVRDPWRTDLNQLEGAAREGIACDFCHKIREVEMDPQGGRPGVLSIRFNRPPPGEQVFYGPYDDVIAGPDTYGPIYKTSLYCAPCHEATFWGTPVYSTYDEWFRSPYREEGKECQACHMAPDGETTRFAPAAKGGLERDPRTIATHRNPGTRDIAFLSDAIEMSLQVVEIGDTVDVVVRLTNRGAGHHFPTGVPMRNMILLVEAVEAGGERPTYLDGPVLARWAGVGAPEEGNYAGLPGVGFARILRDVAKTYPRFDLDVQSPTPHWRQAVIVTDSRIPARTTHVSRYRFLRHRRSGDCVTVTARLIYRRAFKAWIEAKKLPLEDLEIAKRILRSCDESTPSSALKE